MQVARRSTTPSSRAKALRVRRNSARQTSRSVVSAPPPARAPRRARDDRASARYRSLESAATTATRASPRSASSVPSRPDAPAASLAQPGDVRREPVDQDVEVPRRAERLPEPAELVAERLRPRPVEQPATGAEERPQAPGRDTELVQVLGIGAEPDARVVEQEPARLLGQREPERRRAAESRGGRPRRRSGRRDRAPGRASGEARPARRRLAASSSTSRCSVRSSPPTSSTSSSRKRRVTRWPSSTATESSTISAPSARTTSRRVRSRATGRSSRPRRNPTRSDESSSGGLAGGPDCSSSARAAPRGSFSCQRPVPPRPGGGA